MDFSLKLGFLQKQTLVGFDGDGEIVLTESPPDFETHIDVSDNVEDGCIDFDITLFPKARSPDEGKFWFLQLSKKEARAIGKALILFADVFDDELEDE